MAGSVKDCLHCCSPFQRRPRDSDAQWEARSFCSAACANNGKNAEPVHLRFWAQIDRSTDCWTWTGLRDADGYGITSHFSRKLKAHRVSYEMRFGPIPAGAVIRHKCDNPSCVNPDHLVAGTQRENMRDASGRDRLNPKSQLNLRPGAPGFHGAGPMSNKEIGFGRIG